MLERQELHNSAKEMKKPCHRTHYVHGAVKQSRQTVLRVTGIEMDGARIQ